MTAQMTTEQLVAFYNEAFEAGREAERKDQRFRELGSRMDKTFTDAQKMYANRLPEILEREHITLTA